MNLLPIELELRSLRAEVEKYKDDLHEFEQRMGSIAAENRSLHALAEENKDNLHELSQKMELIAIEARSIRAKDVEFNRKLGVIARTLGAKIEEETNMKRDL